MISTREQEQVFLQLGRLLKRKAVCYAIGGTAMMFHGFKDTTLDVDLVFLDADDRAVVEDGLKKLGYAQMNSLAVYGEKVNHPLMYTRGSERFDLFLTEIIAFTFSESMAKHAVQVHEFANLVVHVAAPEAIVLLKCATDRVKDKDDVGRIIDSFKIDYDVLFEEALVQQRLGHKKACFELGCFLEDLSEAGVPIPKSILDRLYSVVQQQLGN